MTPPVSSNPRIRISQIPSTKHIAFSVSSFSSEVTISASKARVTKASKLDESSIQSSSLPLTSGSLSPSPPSWTITSNPSVSAANNRALSPLFRIKCTTKQITGQMRSLYGGFGLGGCPNGNDLPVSSLARASIAKNKAPTPIGPKCPQNSASRYVLTSGMNSFISRTIGIRRNRSTRSRNIRCCPHTAIGCHVTRDELVPRNDRAKENKHAAVEDQIHNGRERELFGFLGEPAVMSKSNTAPKAQRKSLLPRIEPKPTQRIARRR